MRDIAERLIKILEEATWKIDMNMMDAELKLPVEMQCPETKKIVEKLVKHIVEVECFLERRLEHGKRGSSGIN